MKRIFFSVLMLVMLAGTVYGQDPGGYATMRVFDCNRSVAMGSGFLAARIFIVYEDGTTEDISLLPYSEKNEMENLIKVNQVINKLKSKGYFLISQYTTGEQGNLVSDYTFLKQK
ncbi:MAG TPA: hypothetical protein VG603_07920 [Chitinophagales bacterium]|nr:hypothetical protein [Chitinophagales bacterium]